MNLTLIHPAIGHKRGENYIRSWQMEPLPAAAIAGLTPPSVSIRFYDDRMESIPYDEPTGAVVMSLETYTAKRAYQIASEFRRRRVPVIVGGFHASLCPTEAERYADAVVVGEAEEVWGGVLDDLRAGRLKKRYRADRPASLSSIRMNRTIFAGKRYLPVRLLETGRGCPYACHFCAVQTFYDRTYRRRPVDALLAEIQSLKSGAELFFFVDDNFAGDIAAAKDFLRALAPLRVRWVTQLSIHAAHDEEFLDALAKSGCRGVLIGFESLDADTLASMNKPFNTMRGGYGRALSNLKKYGIRVYGTFVFGYDRDTEQTVEESVDFALEHHFYIAAFNHLTPFPGTPLYDQLAGERRLRYPAWWLDDRYRYNDIPFAPRRMPPEALTDLCLRARRRFYSLRGILARSVRAPNRGDFFMWRNFFPINWMHRRDVSGRNGYPLGDETWRGRLIEA